MRALDREGPLESGSLGLNAACCASAAPQAGSDTCPVSPGQPMTAHWGVPDPAKVEGVEEEQRRAFFMSYNQLAQRISIFVKLPLARLDRLALQKKLDEIGQLDQQLPT